MYSAASGMQGRTFQLDAASENLAHANVPGYRGRGVAFAEFQQIFNTATQSGYAPLPANSLVQRPFEPILQGTAPIAVYNDFQPGGVQFTGNPFDLAAANNTYFVLDGPNGPVLTKNGTFERNNLGELTTHSGLRVRGEGGPLALPPDALEIRIAEDGVLFADGNEIGRLQLVAIADPRVLRRVGPTLFEGPVASGRPEPGTVTVQQGYRETSNVNGVTEMVSLIETQRYFEAAQRALLALSDAVGLNTRPQVT